MLRVRLLHHAHNVIRQWNASISHSETIEEKADEAIARRIKLSTGELGPRSQPAAIKSDASRSFSIFFQNRVHDVINHLLGFGVSQSVVIDDDREAYVVALFGDTVS
jgi:hypothetical protein